MDQSSRRLSDRILSAFDVALEQRDEAVADALLRALELALTKEGGPGRPDRRVELGRVTEAYDKLQNLRKRSA